MPTKALTKTVKAASPLSPVRLELFDAYLSGATEVELAERFSSTPAEIKRKIREIFFDMASKSVSDSFDAYAAQLLMDELMDLNEKEKVLRMEYKRKFEVVTKDGDAVELEEDASDALLVPKYKSEKRQIILAIRAIIAKSALGSETKADVGESAVSKIVGAFTEVIVRQAKEQGKKEERNTITTEEVDAIEAELEGEDVETN